MFTGLVEEVGTVLALAREGDAARLAIGCDTVRADLPLGASIAVDGCCLTVAAHRPDGFEADLMLETLRVTALGDLAPGAAVNLERALRADGRLGGHLVQGHVDGVGTVTAVEDVPGTRWLAVRVPAPLQRYLVGKGSLGIAGVSLTVAQLEGDTAVVGLIPHTLAGTNLAQRRVGDRVNLEVDVVAKYVERMLAREGNG